MHFCSMRVHIVQSYTVLYSTAKFFGLFSFAKIIRTPPQQKEMRGVSAPILHPPWMQQLQQPSAQISRKITTMYKKLETTHILFYIFALPKR